MITVPAECLPLLCMQRTHYLKSHQRAQASYSRELRETFDSFASVLPKTLHSVIDIGAGLAGIDVLLSRYSDNLSEIFLYDRHDITNKPRGGFHKNSAGFAAYHSPDLARSLLVSNGVPAHHIHMLNADLITLPTDRFTLAISLLSWGFHYPVEEYHPNADVVVLDVRRHTGGEDKLQKMYPNRPIQVMFEADKFRRVACFG